MFKFGADFTGCAYLRKLVFCLLLDAIICANGEESIFKFRANFSGCFYLRNLVFYLNLDVLICANGDILKICLTI